MNGSSDKQVNTPREHLEAAASQLLKEGKKKINDWCEEGAHKACDLEEEVKACSDHLVHKIQKNPLAAVLIAGGIGYLLAKLANK